MVVDPLLQTYPPGILLPLGSPGAAARKFQCGAALNKYLLAVEVFSFCFRIWQTSGWWVLVRIVILHALFSFNFYLLAEWATPHGGAVESLPKCSFLVLGIGNGAIF